MRYIFFYLLLVPNVLFAASGNTGVGSGASGNTGVGGTSPGNDVSLPNPLGNMTIEGLFHTILNVLMVFAVPLIVFFIIYAGFLYVTAQGNESTIKKAHKALLNAIIGGVLILGANVLLDVLQGTINSVLN